MLAKRPPMGFNTWNTFGTHISDKVIRETADAMVDWGSGMPDMSIWSSTTAGPSGTGIRSPIRSCPIRRSSRTA